MSSIDLNEIGRLVSQAAQSTQEINLNIVKTATIAEHSNTGASDVQTAAEHLEKLAAQLKTLLGEFRT